jgi:sporulation protein YlmC with PRC-barrel domain
VEYDVGSEVACTDGLCGELQRLIVDPVAQAVTHLVVEPRHEATGGRLVPIDHVVSSGEVVRLDCTRAQFDGFEEAEESEFIPSVSEDLGYQPGQASSWPFYKLYIGRSGIASRSLGAHESVYDHVPLGEVEVRRGDSVHATDGEIGRVHGLIIDPRDHHVTHFLLEQGHLWGHKTVAIPISAVSRVGDGVRLTLSKDQVRDLPPVELDHPN